MGDTALWLSLDKELCTMVEVFTNLIKASRIPDDEEQVLWRTATAGIFACKHRTLNLPSCAHYTGRCRKGRAA